MSACTVPPVRRVVTVVTGADERARRSSGGTDWRRRRSPATRTRKERALSGPTISLHLGAPVYAQALRYTAMFHAKPFAEALLVYREGGTYTILSPGEDHHGCYVSATLPLDPPRRVQFTSLPSTDWSDDVATHVLGFAPDTGGFTQELHLPGEPVPRVQHGFAAPVAEARSIDTARGWTTLRAEHAAAFDRARSLAGAAAG